MKLYLQNFRNIGEEGCYITLTPISIFTGCNSSGKSTAAKALLLLDSYLSDIRGRNYNLIQTPLDFARVGKLGSFDSVLNANSKANGINTITLGFSFRSAVETRDFEARLTFGMNEGDRLNYGWLKELLILVESEEMLAITIQDGKYRLAVKSPAKFSECINLYIIRQITAIWTEYQDRKRLHNQFPEEDDDFQIDESIESLRPKIKDLYEKESILINNGRIRALLACKDIDKNLKENINQDLIISALESIVDLKGLPAYMINFEERIGRRITKDDVQTILEEFPTRFFKNLRKDQIEKMLSKRQDLIVSRIQSYIDSDIDNIYDYIRITNSGRIASFVENFNHLNDDPDLDTPYCLFDRISFSLDIRSIPTCYIRYLLKECLNQNFCGRIGYVDASTVDVKRLYPLDSSDRFANLWKNFNNQSFITIENQPGSFMRKWLRDLNICDDIKIENNEGFLQIRLVSEDNPTGRLLADYGYGVTQLVALLLNIENAISLVKKEYIVYAEDSSADGWADISYLFYTLILEEPEVHLHPLLQSRLADIFLDAYKHHVRLIIETHSEYMVRRTQVVVAKNNTNAKIFSVHYFPEIGQPYNMGYRPNGHFQEAFGKGFFDEAGDSVRELMRLERR